MLDNITAIVPAAGLSTRMLGPNKLLLPWEDTTVIGAVTRTLVACGLNVVIVTGRDHEEVAQAAAPGTRAVFNKDYEQGLSTSIRAGVEAAQEGTAILITLGDTPHLAAPDVLRIIEAYENAPDNIILATVYDQNPHLPAHPILFGPAHRDALLSLTGDHGAKPIIEANKEHLHLLPSKNHLPDIDTSEDV